jgi:carbon-monoxide dehydrogenase large subunit
MSSGQSHETTFPQVASEWLEIPFEKIRFIANDTDRVSVGGGSHSGRSMRLVTIALDQAVKALIHRGKAIAAYAMMALPEEITYAEGFFNGPKSQSLDLWQVAEVAEKLNSLPSDLRGIFESFGDITNRAGGYPYGSHVCEVEVDPDTGVVEIQRWTGVDDVGLAINPMVLHGQAHGAIAQGLGQALSEHCLYDSETGQLLAGSFMDYAIPRADVTPSMQTVLSEIPASSHPFGVRPGGEGGTTPALAVVISAIVDALKEYGVKHIEMPATPERVWQAIKDASGNT